MSDGYLLTGTLIHVGGIKTFQSGTQNRLIVIETDGKYSKPVPFNVWKDLVLQFTEKHIGQRLDVHFDVGGREYQGKYYADLTAFRYEWHVKQTTTMPAPEPEAPRQGELGGEPAEDLDDDPLPF